MGVVVRQKIKGKGQPWWVFINHLGKRKSIQVGSKEAAETLADKIQVRLKSGELRIEATAPIPTFGQYAEQWLSTYGETHLKYSTWKGYRSILRNHLSCFGPRPLDQITRPEVKAWLYAKLKTHLSPSTVARIKALLSSVFNHAWEDELIAGNPAARLGKLTRRRDAKADVQPLTMEEAREFLAVVLEHFPRYHAFFLCALRTGMRLGELLGLEWGDVDYRGNFLEVRRAYVSGRITTPKNHKGRRVDMSPQLADTLRALQTERKREALAKGWGEVPERVFINEAGQVIDEGNLRGRVFYKALAKAGLRRVRIHDLRHSFASFLIQNGESLAYVRDQLGHHSIQITVDTYGHLVPGANREAVAKLDDDYSTYASSDRVRLGCVEGLKNGTKG